MFTAMMLYLGLWLSPPLPPPPERPVMEVVLFMPNVFHGTTIVEPDWPTYP